jgi:hypothetical protein
MSIFLISKMKNIGSKVFDLMMSLKVAHPDSCTAVFP